MSYPCTGLVYLLLWQMKGPSSTGPSFPQTKRKKKKVKTVKYNKKICFSNEYQKTPHFMEFYFTGGGEMERIERFFFFLKSSMTKLSAGFLVIWLSRTEDLGQEKKKQCTALVAPSA